MHETCHVELCRRSGILAIAHPLPINPDVHGRLHTAEVQDEILIKHLARNSDEGDVRSHRVAMAISIPLERRLARHTRCVLLKGVRRISVDRQAIILHLPIAWNGNEVPLADVVVGTPKLLRPPLWAWRPVEAPLTVERHNFLALLLERRQLQRGMVRQFVDAYHLRIFPIVWLGRQIQCKGCDNGNY